mgnify:FL=1
MQKFNLQGNFLHEWGEHQPISTVSSFFNFLISPEAEGNFNYPTRIAAGPNSTIYVSDAYNNRVQAFSKDGKFLFQFGGSGFLGGSFRVSSGIAVDIKGHLYVADFYNNRIQMFTEEGSFLTEWGEEGEKIGQLKGPTDITVDDQGGIYVVDWGNHRIQVLHLNDGLD